MSIDFFLHYFLNTERKRLKKLGEYMRFIERRLYNWIQEMESKCRRSFEVEYMRVFEMEDGVRIVMENDNYIAYIRQKHMGASG